MFVATASFGCKPEQCGYTKNQPSYVGYECYESDDALNTILKRLPNADYLVYAYGSKDNCTTFTNSAANPADGSCSAGSTLTATPGSDGNFLVTLTNFKYMNCTGGTTVINTSNYSINICTSGSIYRFKQKSTVTTTSAKPTNPSSGDRPSIPWTALVISISTALLL